MVCAENVQWVKESAKKGNKSIKKIGLRVWLSEKTALVLVETLRRKLLSLSKRLATAIGQATDLQTPSRMRGIIGT